MKNFNKIYKITIVVMSLIFSVACSQQNRSNEWEPDAIEFSVTLGAFFETAINSNDVDLVNTTQREVAPQTDADAQAAAQAPAKVLYYAESGKTGHALSVAGLIDFSILGMPVASLYDLATAKVLLVDSYTSVNREYTLIVNVTFIDPATNAPGEPQTVAFKSSNFKYSDKDLIISFPSFDIQTYDLSDDAEDDLASVVKFKILDKSGIDYGQFSSLVGFGN